MAMEAPPRERSSLPKWRDAGSPSTACARRLEAPARRVVIGELAAAAGLSTFSAETPQASPPQPAATPAAVGFDRKRDRGPQPSDIILVDRAERAEARIRRVAAVVRFCQAFNSDEVFDTHASSNFEWT